MWEPTSTGGAESRSLNLPKPKSGHRKSTGALDKASTTESHIVYNATGTYYGTDAKETYIGWLKINGEERSYQYPLGKHLQGNIFTNQTLLKGEKLTLNLNLKKAENFNFCDHPYGDALEIGLDEVRSANTTHVKTTIECKLFNSYTPLGKVVDTHLVIGAGTNETVSGFDLWEIHLDEENPTPLFRAEWCEVNKIELENSVMQILK